MAITMWDQLIPGLAHLRTTRYPAMDMTYFTFHRELEQSHEEAMQHAVQAMDSERGLARLVVQQERDFQEGVTAVLNYLEGFWMGLEHRRPTHVEQPVRNDVRTTVT